MGAANDRAKALSAELAEARAEAKAERAEERRIAREAQREKDNRETAEYREENYDVTAGDNSNYIGASLISHNGGIEFSVTEWTSEQATVAISREQALALVADLTRLLG